MSSVESFSPLFKYSVILPLGSQQFHSPPQFAASVYPSFTNSLKSPPINLCKQATETHSTQTHEHKYATIIKTHNPVFTTENFYPRSEAVRRVWRWGVQLFKVKIWQRMSRGHWHCEGQMVISSGFPLSTASPLYPICSVLFPRISARLLYFAFPLHELVADLTSLTFREQVNKLGILLQNAARGETLKLEINTWFCSAMMWAGINRSTDNWS